MDAKEKEDERKYGDFILWKQILDFAKAEPSPIILVTGEKKEDWWTKRGGEIVSPHLELRREFQEQVKQPFWMYQTQRFLEMAKEQLTVEINPRSIEEANAVAEAEAAEEKVYEKVSLALQQIQMPTISEDLLKSLRISPISEDLLKSFHTPAISEGVSRAFKQIKRLPADGSQSINQRKSLDKLSNVTGNEKAEAELPLESSKKLDSEQNNDVENRFSGDNLSTESKSKQESQEIESKPKRRSQSKKYRDNNSGK